jgi:hypothetical protein
LAGATITNSLPVIGCCPAGKVILKVILEAAEVTDRIRLRKRQAMASLVQRGARFMVSPETKREYTAGWKHFGVRFSVPAPGRLSPVGIGYTGVLAYFYSPQNAFPLI